MVEKSTFRVFCYVIGFFGIVFMSISKIGTLGKILGILLCVILMAFGFAVTSKWSRYLIGEEQEGSMGKPS